MVSAPPPHPPLHPSRLANRRARQPDYIHVRRPGFAFGAQRIPVTYRQSLWATAFNSIVRNMRAAGWTDMRIARVLHVKHLPAPQAHSASTSIWSRDHQTLFQEAAE